MFVRVFMSVTFWNWMNDWIIEKIIIKKRMQIDKHRKQQRTSIITKNKNINVMMKTKTKSSTRPNPNLKLWRRRKNAKANNLNFFMKNKAELKQHNNKNKNRWINITLAQLRRCRRWREFHTHRDKYFKWLSFEIYLDICCRNDRSFMSLVCFLVIWLVCLIVSCRDCSDSQYAMY